MDTLTKEKLSVSVPSIFATSSFNMSPRYAKINTYDVINAMEEANFYPVNASQASTRKPERKAFARHVVRFRDRNQVQVNDHVPEIILMNSHDGSSAYKMYLGIFRIVCANGLIVAESTIAGISIRHTGQHVTESIIAQARLLSRSASNVSNRIALWSAMQLDQDRQREYARGALELYNPGISARIDPAQVLHARRPGDFYPSLWTTFNNVQENMIKGGFVAASASGRLRHTRAIRSIARDVNLNRGLWAYTENFGKN